MSSDPSQNRANSLFGLMNSTLGKIGIFVTFVTSIFTAVKLLKGDTRLAILILFFVGTGTLWLLSLYVVLSKKQTRTSTIKGGVQTEKKFAYANNYRYAALAVLVMISVLWVVAGFYKKRTPSGNELGILETITGKRVDIEGFVLAAGGDPADKALVTLVVNEKPVATKEAPGGKFTFQSVDITQLGPGAIRLEAKWRNLEAHLPVNLATDQLSNLAIKLPPGPSPFKVEYFVLEGPAIDFLVQGRMDSRWEAKLGGQPTIVGNDVFKTLKDLLDRFSSPFAYDLFEISKSKARTRSEPTVDMRVASRNQNRPFFLGGSKTHPMYKTLTNEELVSLLNPTQKWHLSITQRYGRKSGQELLPSITADSFFFWRFATVDDANMFFQSKSNFDQVKKEAEFYSYLIRNYLPPDFFLFSMEPHPNPRSGCDIPTQVRLNTRTLKLRIALLENISDNPVRIGKFSIKENNLERLRSHDEDMSALNTKPLEQKVFYPSEVLKPKEKLVIPLELLLSHDSDEGPSARQYTTGTSTEVLAELGKVDKINLPAGVPNSPSVEVTTKVLVDMTRTRAENPLIDKEFVYGASLKIDNLDADGVNYPFRALDTSLLVMNGGFRGASCPYVFTYDSETNSWLNEGTILTGFDRKWKESAQEKELTRFDGSILLRERDPETSFLDQLYIKALNYDGSETILFPKNDQLLRRDTDYMVLKQGDQLRIDFNINQGLSAKRYILVAKGYYIADAKRK